MTLEDFFTLTEMKGGLATPIRVEELVAVMKKEKDNHVNNVGDVTRQWSTVASVIAATDDRDCLDLFLQLDGLWFLNRWLDDTQKFGADSGDCFVEESILALLQALEKLRLNNERLNSSGICTTVRNLLSHKNTSIRDKVRGILDDWNHSKVDNSVKLNLGKCEGDNDEAEEPGSMLANENGNSSCSVSDRASSMVNNEQSELLPDGNVDSSGVCSEQQSETVADKLIVSDKEASSGLDHGQEVAKDVPGPIVKLDTYRSVDSSGEICPSGSWRKPESSSLGDHTSPGLKQESNDSKSLVKLESSVCDSMQKSKSGSVSDKLSEIEKSNSGDIFSSNDKEDALEPVEKTVLATNSNDIDSSTVKSICATVDMAKVDSSNEVSVTGVFETCTLKEEFKASGEGNAECSNNILQDSPQKVVKGTLEVPETKPNTIKDVVDTAMEQSKDDSKYFSNSRFFVAPRSNKIINESSKISTMDLECGAIDALEVARLVAKEVESQMDDYYDHFGSSSKKNTAGVTEHPGRPESLHDRKDQNLSDDAPSNELPTVANTSFEAFLKEGEEEKEEPATSSDTMEAEPQKVVQGVQSSLLTEAALQPEASAEKETCTFDLNQDFLSEENDQGTNFVSNDQGTNFVSNSVAAVSASRVEASGLPSSPLKFEGALGWKGSAATSAFRTISVGGTSGEPSSKQDFLFDLNIAEDGDDKTPNPLLGKQNPPTSGLASGDSSVDLNFKLPDKGKFDLNEMSEENMDVGTSLGWKVGGLPLGSQVVHQSPSSASCSSSLRNPGLRNFDLNDRPSNHHDPPSDQHHLFLGQSSWSSHNKPSASGGYWPLDDSVSIMGAKVKKNTATIHQTPTSYPNGRISEVDQYANVTRTGAVSSGAGGSGMPYVPSHVLSYNGVAVGPPIPYSSAMYGSGDGSVAYMVDPRGLTFGPPLMGQHPSSNLPGSFPSNMILGSFPGPNGAGPSRPSLDMNSVFMVEGSNREPSGYRHFVQGQGRVVEEQMRDGLQPPMFTGIVGGKRKEPDGGWAEPFIANYKHHQPPRL